MSSSTWRVLSGYATYHRTPMRMTSLGKWAPLKLIAIVSLPHESSLVIGGDHTANENLRQNTGHSSTAEVWGAQSCLMRRALMPQPCPHCDQLDTSLLRLVSIGE